MKVLIAYDWSDCVKAYRLMERVLLGSVSYAVAARAACSVEVVR